MFDHTPAGGIAGGIAVDETRDATSGVGAPGSVTDITAALATAIDDLLDVRTDVVTDGELAGAMVAIRRQQSRLAAAVAELTAAFDARRAWSADGSRSATDWIAVRARVPRPQAASEVRDARRVQTMPRTRAAWRAGDLCPAHVRVLTGLAGHPRAAEHFADGEEVLVREARRSRFDDWQRLSAAWRDAADPDGPEQRRGRDDDLRRFCIGVGLDGVGHPDGYLTPIATTTVTGALERIEAELFAADWAAAKELHGDATTVAHLARTAAQRRHDALVEMAERAMTAAADGRRPAPLVTVLVDYPTLAGRVCELTAGTVIAPGDIAELLGRDDTLIQRVVFDGPNRIRDISTARTFRGTLRRILDVVHRRCGHGTCFVPAHLCEGDHITAWSDGGLTTQDNGRLGCGFHNRWWYSQRRADPPPRDGPVDGDAARSSRRPPTRIWGRVPPPDAPDLVADGADGRMAVDLQPLRSDASEPWHDLAVGPAA